MANWKEKGEVPDSDDEDTLDSQNTNTTSNDHDYDSDQLRIGELSSLENQNFNTTGNDHDNELRNDDEPEETQKATRHESTGNGEHEGNQFEGRDGEDEKNEEGLKSSPLTVFDAASTLDIQDKTTLEDRQSHSTPQGRGISATNGRKAINSPPLSPDSPQRVFKVPKPFWEEDPSSSKKQLEPTAGNTKEFPAGDEISKSYVRISSPSLGFPSSTTQPKLPSITRFESQNSLSPGRRGDPLLDTPPEPSPPKRSLRQRNLIQLHPYIIEQQKFQQTCKASGFAPIRIANSSQEEARPSRDTASPDPDFQESESQEVDSQEVDSQNVVPQNEESQLMDFEWDAFPSSPPPIIEQSNTTHGLEEHASKIDTDDEFPDIDDLFKGSQPTDDEFPDLDELLKQQQHTMSKTGSKPRLKSYSKKTRGLPLKTLVSSSTKALHNASTNDIFNIPASPPQTSSPLPSTSLRFNHSSLSRVLSSSSRESAPLSLPQYEVSNSRGGGILTPATSAMKPVSEVVLINSDSESGNPFASDMENTASLSSSSEDSVLIRRVGKKIRGVLPASHLRLEQKRNKAQSRPQRNSMSMSPVKGPARRGVALPRTQSGANNTPRAENGLDFLSSDSGEDSDNEQTEIGSIMNEDSNMELDNLFDESRQGIAEEDNRIDAMLPSRKRQSATSYKRPNKRRRLGSVLSRNEKGAHKRQPRITDHLEGQTAKSRGEAAIKSRRRNENQHTHHRHSTSSYTPPPRLSILDVADLFIQNGKEKPLFLRIAVRAAGSRRGLGKHSPSRKFIRLANREDTQDAQTVLVDWKRGNIQPKLFENSRFRDTELLRTPLLEIQNGRQMKLPSPTIKNRAYSSTHSMTLEIPRTLMVSKAKQSSMTDFVTRQVAKEHNAVAPSRNLNLRAPQSHQTRGRHNAHAARPAQLESSEAAYSHKYPNTAFKTTKRALDSLYRNARRQPVQQRNIPLSRFLAGEDTVLPSIEPVLYDDDNNLEVVSKDSLPEKIPWRKKRPPQRIDAGAAAYRQPSNPLILGFLTTTQSSNSVNGDNKLQGLGKFGTNYSLHFDVFPLTSGTFFHESTFIGSGRLAAVTESAQSIQERVITSSILLNFGNREFSWGRWEDRVSSELGICFDWLADKLMTRPTFPNSPNEQDPLKTMTSISDYFQTHLSFVNPLDISECLFRMADIIQDFSARLDETSSKFDQYQLKQVVGVSAVCASLLLQLLQMARSKPEYSPVACQFEDLLKKVAGQCVGFCICDGLDNVRKLYDDLQYLSFRESGIKGDRYAVEAWVIVIKVLGAANISRGSFWDVTNPRLASIPIKDINDAPNLEKVWYSMYSLLPLSEFDEFGVVSNLRQTTSFDNWSLPQKMVKRVFQMYDLNPRQPPGFNDYCRSIVGRCQYLMMEWGWWKGSTMIGTLFDLFASRDLANLRNEEAYASPHFLEELNTQPSLSVEREDRCFHIFLKIVALQIKHYRETDDIKNIRNLVPRLLPNHNREYPKEKVIHQRDLACLRNQHDLLCTLFWAAPPDLRPSISQLQDLVIADRSHKEACLINLRAWQNLARFIVTSTASRAAYDSLRVWHSTMVRVLVQSYQRTEQDSRRQAENIPSVSEGDIAENIKENKKATASQIRDCLTALTSILALVQDVEMLKEVTDFDLIRRALGLHLHEESKNITECLFSECQKACVLYTRKVKIMCASGQESARLQVALIEPLSKQVLPSLRLLVRKYLENDCNVSTRSFSIDEMVNCFAHLAYHVTQAGKMQLTNFLLRGENAVFENRSRYQLVNDYWPYFLGVLLGLSNLDDFKLPCFDIGKEWLLAIIQPMNLQQQQEKPKLKENLSRQLQAKGHCFLTDIDLDRSNFSSLVRFTIRKMKTLLLQNTTQAELGLSREKAEKLFSDTLEEMMKSAQQYLEAMIPHTEIHIRYLEQIQAVVRDIRCYASDFRPLIDFFIRPSRHYWPDQSDPGLVSAGLRSYAVRIHGNQKTTSFELFYYLFNDWKNALVSGNTRVHQNAIISAMRQYQFAHYMFHEFIPAVLCVGAGIKGGWLLCASYLPTISESIITLRDRSDERSDKLFELTINLLKLVMNAITEISWQHENGIGGASPQHRGLLAVIFSFYFAIARFVKDYADNGYLRKDTPSPTRTKCLEELRKVMAQIDEFVKQRRSSFVDPTVEFWPPDEEERDIDMGEFGNDFVKLFKEDIKTSFNFKDANGFDVVVMVKGQDSAVQTHQTLSQVFAKRFMPNQAEENHFFGFFPTSGYIL